MSSDLVPYEQGHLIPKGTKTAGIVICLPGNPLDHVGPAALALTEEAIYLVAPDRRFHKIPLQNILRVSHHDFSGITIPKVVDNTVEPVTPQDASGVIVEYQEVGKFTAQLSLVTHFANAAYAWVGVISQAVTTHNRKLMEQNFPKKLDRDT